MIYYDIYIKDIGNYNPDICQHIIKSSYKNSKVLMFGLILIKHSFYLKKVNLLVKN